MSTVSQLPSSCADLIDFKRSSKVRGVDFAQPGQHWEASVTWTAVPEADFTAFLDVVYGLPEVVGGFGGAVVRIVPLRHPRYPKLLAVNCEAEGFGRLVGGWWEFHRVTVNFASPLYATDGQMAFMTKAIEPSSRTIPVPAVAMRVGGVTPTFDPGREIPGQTVTFSMHQVPTADISVFQGYTGCVNSSAFLGCRTGTVLYRAPRATTTSTYSGVQSYEITHAFDVSSLEWNYGVKPDGTFALMTRADGNLNYPLVDLTTLFSS